MKRGRSSSKSSAGVGDASSKEEPPKKVKKRIKQVATSTSAPAVTTTTTSASAAAATPPSTPGSGSVVSKPLVVPRETKLGSLPLYGEQLPSGGYDDIPGAAQQICGQLKEVMTKVREIKQKNAPAEDEKVHVVV